MAAQEKVGRTNEWWLGLSRSHLGCILISVAATDFEAPLATQLATLKEAEDLLQRAYDQLHVHPEIEPEKRTDRLEPPVKGMIAVYQYRARIAPLDAKAQEDLACGNNAGLSWRNFAPADFTSGTSDVSWR